MTATNVESVRSPGRGRFLHPAEVSVAASSAARANGRPSGARRTGTGRLGDAGVGLARRGPIGIQ